MPSSRSVVLVSWPGLSYGRPKEFSTVGVGPPTVGGKKVGIRNTYPEWWWKCRLASGVKCVFEGMGWKIVGKKEEDIFYCRIQRSLNGVYNDDVAWFEKVVLLPS